MFEITFTCFLSSLKRKSLSHEDSSGAGLKHHFLYVCISRIPGVHLTSLPGKVRALPVKFYTEGLVQLVLLPLITEINLF